MPSSYLHRVQAINRNQNVNDVQRGMEIGQEVGKMLGGLSQAIKGAQADSAANQLMTQQNISAQPGAGVTQDLGTLDGGPQPAAQGGAPKGQLMSDPDPDPIQTNQPGASINPDFQPEFTTQDMPDLSGAAKQQKTQSQLSGGPQPAAQTSSDNWNLSQFGGGTSVGEGAFPGGAGTVGGLIGTGGTKGLELQKEMLAQKLQQAQLAKATAPPPAPDPLDVALKQTRLAQAQQNLVNPRGSQKTPVDKTSLASNMDTEPVEDQSQLVRTYDSTHGKGAFDDTVSAFNAPDSVPDPNNPGKTLPNGPVVSGNSVTLNPNSKNPVSLQLGEAQTIAKQLNTRRIAQGLPPISVPGVDSSLGSTRANPIDVKTRLDGASIPRGRWIRTPTGQIIQRP